MTVAITARHGARYVALQAALYVARVVVVAVVCAFTTSWFGWISLPFVGFIYSLIDGHARARGTIAALGAAAGWLAILGADVARGVDVRMVAVRVGAVMQLPWFIFVAMTLVFAALLCGIAAILGASLRRGGR